MNISADTASLGADETFEMPMQLLQPWSTPILKTRLPEEVLRRLLALTDEILGSNRAQSFGHGLVGQICDEKRIPIESLNKIGVLGFLEGVVKEFVVTCKCQQHPFKNELVRSVPYTTKIISCWALPQ